ncbi:Coiled-coil domain-containing protein 25 [Taenia crassiceps]|uniref:Coiled-coil domain-containing protein 25 n=1 Tax=Taenia crassiceps TaxID=6207 RepID=A0ABR4Q277_9CEST
MKDAPCKLNSIGFQDIFSFNTSSNDKEKQKFVGTLNECVTADSVVILYCCLGLIILSFLTGLTCLLCHADLFSISFSFKKSNIKTNRVSEGNSRTDDNLNIIVLPLLASLFVWCLIISSKMHRFAQTDKHENDQLIRWGWPEDVWFHVDKMSSAHVYLRLREGETLDDVPETVIQDCAQLCKQNSIMGCKQNDVTVVYTMWENLKKTPDMDVGQVGFHNGRSVRRTVVAKRVGEVLRRLERTQTIVESPDLQAEREERDERLRQRARAAQRARERAEREAERQRQAEADRRSYDRIFVSENMRSNEDGYDSDDFM